MFQNEQGMRAAQCWGLQAEEKHPGVVTLRGRVKGQGRDTE